MDHFVRPTMTVSDYRTSVTGIVKENLEPGTHGTLILQLMAHPQLTP
jgi:hypothetical protein